MPVTTPVGVTRVGVALRRLGFPRARIRSGVHAEAEAVGDGLLVHAVVRDTVNQDLLVRDPDRRHVHRCRAVRQLASRAQDGRVDPWQYIADLMYLIENPGVAGCLLPDHAPQPLGRTGRPARPVGHPGDRIAARDARRCRGAHRLVDASSAVLLRGQELRGSVAAFVQIMDLDDLDPALFTRDPVAAGRTNREIGELLFISEKTASRHLSNEFDKLGIHTRAEAARIAAENGLTTATY